MGRTVASTKREDGERVYTIAQVVLPSGISCPPGFARGGFSCFQAV
jgi:hypothetical protein